MASPIASSLALLLLLLLSGAATAALAGGGVEGPIPLVWISSASSGQMAAGCNGSIEECLAGGEELAVGTEVSGRRMLGTSDYISYGALKRDTTPCSQSGASYYNCRPGAEANPYSRSCSAIDQCRG